MSAWTSHELDTIGRAEQLELTRVKSDGTPRKPVTIWVVSNKVDLFIRSWRGDVAAWFRNAQARPEAHAKYALVAPSYVGPIVTPRARATTLKLERRS